jgi:methylmalonyl-CoA mutase
MVLQATIGTIDRIKATRDTEKSKLKKINPCAQTGEGNLLEIAVEAARNRTTLGEISDALKRF